MPPSRDPLSVKYDRTARHVLLTAIRAHQANPRQPRAARVWVHSSGAEFRDLDRGGRTASERAFMRAVYYQITKTGRQVWSAKLEWGRVERRGSRYGRHLRVRLFRYGSGYRAASRKSDRAQWWRDEGTWRSGGRRSVPGDRIDSNRRRAG